MLNDRKYEVADGQDPQPLPAWIADLLDPPQRAPAAVSVPRGLSDRVASRFDGLIAAVLNATEGERNNVLHWAACRAAEMITKHQLTAEQVQAALAEAALAAGLTDHEAERTIASALRRESMGAAV